ncbi:MAG TPA: DUF2177 family protein [bacterium]|nr:DUF2177 family protein [bacterium]
MTLLRYAKIFFLTVPIMAALDLLWLGVVARGFYQDRLAHLLSGHVNWAAALIFYAVYAGGVLLFAVVPNIPHASIVRTAVYGALLGLFAYGTYDLTNWATLKEWPASIVIVDMAWGCVITAVTAAAAAAIERIIP